jgi:O-antigen/teichoic acid export membrane protein
MEAMAPRHRELTQGTLLARNAIWNLLGQTVPLLVAVVTIPVLLRAFGTERFGLLTLAWLVTGYFSVFDLGLGRALTQVVSQRATADDDSSLRTVVTTGLLLMLGLGIVGGVVLAAISRWLVGHALNIPAALQPEALTVFRYLAISVPMVVGASAARGVLEGLQRFGAISVIRVIMGALTFLTPLAVLPFSRDLSVVVLAMVVVRAVVWLVHLALCLRAVPGITWSDRVDFAHVVPMLKLGSWMTVSNLVGPLLNYLDRFVITAMISVAALTYYATPYELVTKAYVIPIAITGVLFPAFAASLLDPAKIARLFHSGVTYILLLLFPGLFLLSTFAREGLALWLGAEFAAHGSRVLQLLAVSIFINSLALTPFSLLQSTGRARWTAMLHLVQVPLTVVLLVAFIKLWGLPGAAWATLVRLGLEAIVLFVLAIRDLHTSSAALLKLGTACVIAVAGFVPAWMIEPLAMRIIYAAVLVPVLLGGVWLYLSTTAERSAIRNIILRRSLAMPESAETTVSASS